MVNEHESLVNSSAIDDSLAAEHSADISETLSLGNANRRSSVSHNQILSRFSVCRSPFVILL
jgi:hypothetical protein